MSVRELKFKDYGITREQEKEIRAYYRGNDLKRNTEVFNMAQKIKPELTSELYFTIVKGMSYESLDSWVNIPIPKTDFYGYQRKVYAELFRNMRENEKRHK